MLLQMLWQGRSRRRILVLNYSYPDWWMGDDSEILRYLGSTRWYLGPYLVNPADGPGDAANSDYTQTIALARSRGAEILGYVATGWGHRPLADILDEVDRHVRFYGVDGIFLDEGATGTYDYVGTEGWYEELYATLKRTYGSRFIVGQNPGNPVSPRILASADFHVTFEGSAQDYLSWSEQRLVPQFYRQYPATHFWHIVYGIRDEQQAQQVLERASRSHVTTVALFDWDAAHSPVYGRTPASWILTTMATWANDLQGR